MGWIRNEWILDTATGEWVQDRSRLCIIDLVVFHKEN